MMAFLRPFHALLHRELRDRRAFILALLLCVPVLSMFAQLTWLEPGDEELVAQWILPGLLALVLGAWGADLGAREMENGTDVAFARLPVGKGTLLAAKFAALILGGALLAGWIVAVELLWRSQLGWPVEPLLGVRLPVTFMTLPILALGSWTMAVILGRTFVAVLAALTLLAGTPMALRQVAEHVPLVDDALFAMASLHLDTWLVVVALALASAAAFAYRPGRRDEVRAFLGACLGAALLVGPAAGAAFVRSWTPHYPISIQVAPSPEGDFVAVQTRHARDNWWDARQQTNLWLLEIDEEQPLQPLHLSDAELVPGTSWNEEGELELYDRREGGTVWAYDPEVDGRRPIEFLYGGWCERQAGPDRSTLYTWDGYEWSLPHGAPERRPAPSVPGLFVWGDRDTGIVWSQSMEEEDARELCRVERLGFLLVSPYAPIVGVWDNERDEHFYVHAETGEILSETLGQDSDHETWVDLDDVYVVEKAVVPTTTFRFLGADPPAPLTVDGHRVHLRFLGEDRVVTWSLHPTGPVVLRDLQGQAIATLWE